MSQEFIENSQELEGSDSDAACKNMALEAWGTHAQHTPTAQQPFKLYESSASQAVVPVPSISNEFTEPPYNSAVKLNVQITNVPEVTNLKSTDDLKQVATGTFNGLKHSTEQLLEVLDHPKQLADAVVSGVQTTNTTAQYYSAHPQQIGSDTKKIFLATGQTVIDTLGSPLHQNEIGEHAGELMPDFVAFGKIKALDTKELEVLGGVEKLAPRITFGHGVRHAIEQGVNPYAVESDITTQITEQSSSGAIFKGQFWGQVELGSSKFVYKGYVLPENKIHIGTFYVPKWWQ